MSRHGLLRSTATSSGATPTPIVAKKKRRCGEVMGGATAECTAVVCCCPFAVMDMLVLALYKAPKGMCKKAIDKNRRKRKNARLLKQQHASDVVLHDGGKKEEDVVVMVEKQADEAMEAVDLEMYDNFYGTGFWRSSSQRSSSL
ncbi:hypothetical protein QQ045_026371 [Rhodiola kirilowii]